MIIAPTRQGNVVIDIPYWNIRKNEPNRNVGIRISGGADSAIIAYMLALYVRDYHPGLKIHPITCENPNKPYQIIFAKRVIAKVEELTGVKFESHNTLVIPGVGNYSDEQVVLLNSLYDQNKIDCHFMGETRNPPMEEYLKFKEQFLPDDRHEDGPVVDFNYKRFRPLRTSHKKSVYDLYVHFGVLETLFPITRSCEDSTTDFSKHCGKCPFCEERLWGFGRYV